MSIKKEILDVYDNNGNITGKTVIRGEYDELSDNEHIPVVTIFIENENGEFLVQKTSKEKGGYFSFTGGHVDTLEKPFDAVKREVKEELGISIDNENIEDLGFIIFNRPIRFLYYLRKNININELTLQKEEVEYVKFMKIGEIDKLIETKDLLKSHGILFNKIIKKID